MFSWASVLAASWTVGRAEIRQRDSSPGTQMVWRKPVLRELMLRLLTTISAHAEVGA